MKVFMSLLERKKMAFIAALSLAPSTWTSSVSLCRRPRTPITPQWNVSTSDVLTHVVAQARGNESGTGEQCDASGTIPSSFEAACEQACEAMRAALTAGQRRLFVELDTTNGDATYTTLKTTVPTVRALLEVFENFGPVQLVFPDAGAAALAKRDWKDSPGSDPSKQVIVGMEQYIPQEDDAAIVIIVPRASEVGRLATLVEEAGNTPVVMVNPDLIDMGVTGLSLNARRLRSKVIDLFDNVYYLKVFPWGVLYRRYPEPWTVWVDDEKQSSGFRCITTFPEKPSTDEIQDLLDEESKKSGSSDSPGPIAKAFNGFRRFLNVYTKG